MQRGLVGLDPVDDALIEVGGADSPDPAGKWMLWLSCTLER